jgi:UDP-2,3-diacylglucosamine pyrophosphatase LpxH
MKIKQVYKQLDVLFEEAERVKFEKNSKFVVFSDLHMGDGSSKDDFRSNATLFENVLQKYYLPNDFGLILNWDVEELQRFPLKKIMSKWSYVFDIFKKFQANGGIWKLLGNHDLTLVTEDQNTYPMAYNEALVLEHPSGEIFLFHGHQASTTYQKHNKLVGYTLKYLANPLRITNYSVAHDSRKQYAIEKKVYHHASFRKHMAIIGHTHRPLFESLSKPERLKYQIERLCRDFAREEKEDVKKSIKKLIKSKKKELKKIFKKNPNALNATQLYNSIFHIPCLFNSGCTIGKRGITCLEIDHEKISLIHWFDKNVSDKYLKRKGYEPELIDDGHIFRMPINEEFLDYIFTRIRLLS